MMTSKRQPYNHTEQYVFASLGITQEEVDGAYDAFIAWFKVIAKGKHSYSLEKMINFVSDSNMDERLKAFYIAHALLMITNEDDSEGFLQIFAMAKAPIEENEYKMNHDVETLEGFIAESANFIETYSKEYGGTIMNRLNAYYFHDGTVAHLVEVIEEFLTDSKYTSVQKATCITFLIRGLIEQRLQRIESGDNKKVESGDNKIDEFFSTDSPSKMNN